MNILISTDKYSSHLSEKELLFGAKRVSLIKMQRLHDHGSLAPTGPSPMQLLHLGLWGCRKIVRDRNHYTCCKIVSSRHDRGAAPMRSQQYGCLNKTYAMTNRHANIDKELQAFNGCWIFSKDLNKLSSPKWASLNAYINEQKLNNSVGLHIHTHI